MIFLRLDSSRFRILISSTPLVNTLLRDLIADPIRIRCPVSQERESNAGISRLQHELDRELDKPDYDESAAKAIILSIASAKMNDLGYEDYETIRIRRALVDTNPEREPTAALLHAITEAVIMDDNGEVSLKLKNGQIIERSCTT